VGDDGLLSALEVCVSDGDARGRTALHPAARFGNAALAKMLLCLGAEVKARCYIRTTIPHRAMRKKATEIVELQVKHGADTTLEQAGPGPNTPPSALRSPEDTTKLWS